MVKRVFVEAVKQEIIQEYTKNMFCTIAFLSRKHSCSPGMIRNLLTSKKIDIRGQAEAQRKIDDITENDIIRFWSKVNKGKSDDCWNWLASNKGGYGTFCFRNKQISAHRFSFVITHGDIIGDKHVLHTCDTPSCCNPKHLFLGTHLDNMEDRNVKGRAKGGSLKGEKNKRSRFKTEDILNIRKMAKEGYKQKHIAKEYNTAQAVISNIVNKKYWKHI